MVGDNIYYRGTPQGPWVQVDSHHSMGDGTINIHNLNRDTKADRVLISRHFYYFGEDAPKVPTSILNNLGFSNGIGHRTYTEAACKAFLEWLSRRFNRCLNQVVNDPFDFNRSDARYSVKTDRVSL